MVVAAFLPSDMQGSSRFCSGRMSCSDESPWQLSHQFAWRVNTATGDRMMVFASAGTCRPRLTAGCVKPGIRADYTVITLALTRCLLMIGGLLCIAVNG